MLLLVQWEQALGSVSLSHSSPQRPSVRALGSTTSSLKTKGPVFDPHVISEETEKTTLFS